MNFIEMFIESIKLSLVAALYLHVAGHGVSARQLVGLWFFAAGTLLVLELVRKGVVWAFLHSGILRWALRHMPPSTRMSLILANRHAMVGSTIFFQALADTDGYEIELDAHGMFVKLKGAEIASELHLSGAPVIFRDAEGKMIGMSGGWCSYHDVADGALVRSTPLETFFVKFGGEIESAIERHHRVDRVEVLISDDQA